jgi:uncharacterized protein YbjQ (UPF0145 family)
MTDTGTSGDGDFVPTGSPSGWYQSPYSGLDFYYTGKGFGTYKGEHIKRAHPNGNPTFVPAGNDEVIAWVSERGVESLDSIPRYRVTTTEQLPGHQITQVIGVVTQLESASGWTAASKGNSALDRAMSGLSETAASMGANAIVGLHASTFGAHGGITSGLGGDAVGVLLVGTAVVVMKD